MLDNLGVTIWTLALSFSGPVHNAVHDNEPGSHPSLRQIETQRYNVSEGNLFGVVPAAVASPVARRQEYYLLPYADNFEEAARRCQQHYGGGSGLAVIRNQQELSDLTAFLASNGTPYTRFWIDGAYDPQQQKFYWTRLARPDGTRVYFAQFVKNLMKSGVRQSNGLTRTMIIMQDRYTPVISTSTWTQVNRSVCQRGY